MIIGGPGAGKTWLGRRLAEKLALPLTHVDDHVWRPDRSIHSATETDRALTEIALGENWIIDGGNTRTYAIRAARADTIIWLTPPCWLRLLRVMRRLPSFSLLWWAWKYDSVFGPADRAVSGAGPHTTIHRLTTRRAVRDFLESAEN